MTIAVTGGAGYIGSYVCRALLSAGHKVVVIDNLSTGDQANLPDTVVFYQGDFADPQFWSQMISRHNPEVAIHLAGKIDAAESVSQPELYLAENAQKTQRLLDFFQELGLKRVVFASSAAVYGDAKILPTPEAIPLQPLNPYGESKQLAEEALERFAGNGNQAVALRFFNVCGSLPEVGIVPKIEAALLSSLRKTIHDPTDTFEIYGNDYPTPDGSCQRDFVHVADIAAAFLAVINHWDELEKFAVINIGTAQPHSVLEIIRAAEQILGRRIPYRVAPGRSSEIVTSIADNRQMKELLNLELKYSDLDTILKTSLDI